MNRIAKAKQRWGFVKARNCTKSRDLSQLRQLAVLEIGVHFRFLAGAQIF